MRMKLLGAACALVLGCVSTTALAEAYVDYTPQKGHWTINAIEVDPNHVDDYLTGLKSSQLTAFEVLKKRGLIDDWKFLVRKGYMKGAPTVLIMTLVPNDGLDDPDQTRDQTLDKEIYAAFSKEKGEAMVKGYEKYRTFIDNSDWKVMDMKK